MQIKNILLDLDGTVADPYQAIAQSLIYACEQLGYAVPTEEQVRKCIGPPFSESMGPILGIPEEQQALFLQTYRDHHGVDGIKEYKLYPDMQEILSTLSQQYKLYLATSKPQVYSDEILVNLKVDQYFSGAVGAELDGSRSHKKDIIAHVLTEYEINAKDSLMIGDRMHDALGAQYHNMPWAGVLWGFGSEAELLSYSPLYLFRRQKDLLTSLRQ